MATYYSLGGSSLMMTDLAAALSDYYGQGVTIHVASTSYLLFSCPAISDKIIRLAATAWNWQYGTTFSGSSLTDGIVFGGGANGSSQGELVLADSHMLLAYRSSSGSDSMVVLLGLMTNGDFLAACFGGSSYSDNCKAYNTTTGEQRKVIVWNNGFGSFVGTLYKQPLVIASTMQPGVETDANGFATIPGVYNISYPRNLYSVVGPNYLITTTHRYSSLLSATELTTPLCAEFSNAVLYRQ